MKKRKCWNAKSSKRREFRSMVLTWLFHFCCIAEYRIAAYLRCESMPLLFDVSPLKTGALLSHGTESCTLVRIRLLCRSNHLDRNPDDSTMKRLHQRRYCRYQWCDFPREGLLLHKGWWQRWTAPQKLDTKLLGCSSPNRGFFFFTYFHLTFIFTVFSILSSVVAFTI